MHLITGAYALHLVMPFAHPLDVRASSAVLWQVAVYWYAANGRFELRPQPAKYRGDTWQHLYERAIATDLYGVHLHKLVYANRRFYNMSGGDDLFKRVAERFVA